jgi:SAM-dependent methyltransferase
VTAAEIFEALHRDLPQQGPGSDASTLRALSLVPRLPGSPEILDLGCGPGRQTLALARATGGRVTAVDTAPGFLAELARRASEAGLAGRIVPRRESIDALTLPDACFDLVWAEGALYTVGFETALRAVRRLLRPRGALAATELCWLTEAPPAAARDFWGAAYPEMARREDRRRSLATAGYAPVADFALPASDWWRASLRVRLRLLRRTPRRVATRSDLEAFSRRSLSLRS